MKNRIIYIFNVAQKSGLPVVGNPLQEAQKRSLLSRNQIAQLQGKGIVESLRLVVLIFGVDEGVEAACVAQAQADTALRHVANTSYPADVELRQVRLVGVVTANTGVVQESTVVLYFVLVTVGVLGRGLALVLRTEQVAYLRAQLEEKPPSVDFGQQRRVQVWPRMLNCRSAYLYPFCENSTSG